MSNGTAGNVSGGTHRPGSRSLRRLRSLARLARSVKNLVLDYAYDLFRFARFSGTFEPTLTRTRLKAGMILDYHAIEKGLSLRDPRLGFGQARIQRLLENTKAYLRRYGADETVETALSVLEAYLDFHQRHGWDLDGLHNAHQSLCQEHEELRTDKALGGVFRVMADELRTAARGDFEELVRSRHSVRQFSSQPVDLQTIRKAVELAIQSPSVCNRPSWKVRVYSGRAKDQVLALQHGNQGFGHEAPLVLIITGDLEYFRGNRERNQVYIDGGLFAMSLLYALHYCGLGACALNLCNERRVDKELRQAAHIPASESFIMMIAVGHLEEATLLTRSHRPGVDQVLVGVRA